LVVAFASIGAAEVRQSVRLENPFRRGHRLQPVSSVLTVTRNLLPASQPITIRSLSRYVGLKDDASGEAIPVQWSDLQAAGKDGAVRATANYLTDLPARTTRVLRLVGPLTGNRSPMAPITIKEDKAAKAIEVRTGRLGVRLPAQGSDRPPLLAVCRFPAAPENGDAPRAETVTWRGVSRFINAGPVESMTVERSAIGPVFYRHTVTYRFALGTAYRCSVTCWAGLDYLTVEEATTGAAGEHMRWEFDLEDWPTHVYTAGHGPTHKFVSSYRHSGTYLDFPLAERKPGEEFLWLPNYLIWSRFKDALLACFVRSAAGPGGAPPFEPDLLAIFQVRRGEWEDKLWEARTRRPLGDLPWRSWSTARWWGSRFGVIRVARNQHPKSGAVIKLNFAPGIRTWALWMGDAASLPSPRRRLTSAPLPSLIKTAIGEVRLNELQHAVLDWQPDPKVAHPRMQVTPAMLEGMKQKAGTDPFFAKAFEGLQKDSALRALLDKNQKAASNIARGVLGDLNSRFNYPLTDGIEFSSHLSPVGIRPVFQHATKIDLLLGAEGLLDPQLQKQLRERFAYLAYLLCDSSFMAHKYNAGHPNFDADRYVAIAGIAMLYPEHPHAKRWLGHAVGCLREAMRIYVIPQSGKWAENLGGYYGWSTNIIGGMAHALKLTGSADPYAWPEFQNFWRWGLVAALPAKPAAGRLGKIEPSGFRRWRQIPGIGDNGGDGGVGVHGAYALSGAAMLQHSPELGQHLLWLWDRAGRGRYGHYPYSMFFGLTSKELEIARAPSSAPKLQSQVLEGYGSIFRTDFGRPTESYLLFKCGPGGYRYQAEEGSFVMFGLGQPLTLDGARNYKAEHHSTVTFGEQMMGLRRGRIVQFESTPHLDYTCGRFPGTPEQLLPPGQRPQWPRSEANPAGFYRLVSPESDKYDEGVLATDLTFHRESDAMTRQVLFRKNDFVVICDQIDSILDSQWRLLLLARELIPLRRQILANGWLGVDVAVSLFHLRPGSDKLKPVKAAHLEIDPQPVKQQRITLRQRPGVSVVALLDFCRAGEQPWRVRAKRRVLILSSPDGGATETIELSGAGIPSARWGRMEDDREVASWQCTGYDDPWQVGRPAAIKDGEVYIGGPRPKREAGEGLLLCPAGVAHKAEEAREHLMRSQEATSALQQLGLWSTVVFGPQHLAVLEPDQAGGLRCRHLRDATTRTALTGRAEQALRNRLRPQIAVLRLGDEARHGTALALAHRTLTQWAGYAVQEVTEADLLAGKLAGHEAAVLWQATASNAISDEAAARIRQYVEGGGTLLCDMPFLAGKGAAWTEILGLTCSGEKPLDELVVADEELGRLDLRSPTEGPWKQVSGDGLGLWDVRPVKGTRVVKEVTGRSAAVIHSHGRGRTVTLCFRALSVGPDPDNQVFLAKLLLRILSEAGLEPLVDAPWVEKTIVAQDGGGLMVCAWNPREAAIRTPLRLPHHDAPRITPIYVPAGGSVGADHLTLPARRWIAFGVK